MDILFLLIPLSVVLALAIAAGFLWSVRHGQFDDLEGPAHRILSDDDTGAAVHRMQGDDDRLAQAPSPDVMGPISRARDVRS